MSNFQITTENDQQLLMQIVDALDAYTDAKGKHHETGEAMDAKSKALAALLLIAHDQHKGVTKFRAFLRRLPKAQRISHSWAYKLMRRVQSPAEVKKQKEANARANRLSRERKKTKPTSEARWCAEQVKAEAAKARAEATKARAEAARARSENAKAKAEACRRQHEAFASIFGGGRHRKVKMDAKTRETLVKALGMLGSEHDSEVLAAARMAEKVRRKLGVTWEQIITDAAEPIAEAA